MRKAKSLFQSSGGEAKRNRIQRGMDWVEPLTEVDRVTTPSGEALLIGPAERYHVGMMLRNHVLSRVLNLSKFRCASLTSGDMSEYGGHVIRNYGEGALEMVGNSLQLIHCSGDRLGMGLTEGYASGISGEEADRFDGLSMIEGEEKMQSYVQRRSGQMGDLAYVLEAEGEFHGAGVSFHSVGLSEPDILSEGEREHLFRALKQANFIGVRDENGYEFLKSEGFDVEKMPCPLTVLPQVGVRRLRERQDCDALDEVRRRFPNGWIAVEVSQVSPQQVSSLCEALREMAEREGLGLVFFAAEARSSEAASAALRSWVERFPDWVAAEYKSNQIWEVASLLLHSRLYCGSDLDCRIIAMAGGIARINIPTGGLEVRSYAELWEHDDVPIEFSEEENWIVGLEEVLEVDLSILQQHAAELHTTYLEALAKFCEATGIYQRLAAIRPETAHERAHAGLHHLHDEWLCDDESIARFKQLNRHRGARNLMRSSLKRKRCDQTPGKVSAS